MNLRIYFARIFCRFNLTNVEEPQFSLENLDTLTSMMTQENNSLKLRIYAYNQKGRSPLYLLSDFIIGSSAYKSGECAANKCQCFCYCFNSSV